MPVIVTFSEKDELPYQPGSVIRMEMMAEFIHLKTRHPQKVIREILDVFNKVLRMQAQPRPPDADDPDGYYQEKYMGLCAYTHDDYVIYVWDTYLASTLWSDS